MIASSFASILSSTTSSRVTTSEPTKDPAFLMSLFYDASTPGHHSEEDGACNNRQIEHLEHPVADTKGPEPPQEVKPAQALFVDCLCVCSPLQFIVQHHTQVFVCIHNVSVSSMQTGPVGGSVVILAPTPIITEFLQMTLRYLKSAVYVVKGKETAQFPGGRQCC